jgi:hypothetical protein
MHKKLTVGVVALSKAGEVGASSTLGPLNEHRGLPAFPCVMWSGSAGGGGKQTVIMAAEKPTKKNQMGSSGGVDELAHGLGGSLSNLWRRLAVSCFQG